MARMAVEATILLIIMPSEGVIGGGVRRSSGRNLCLCDVVVRKTGLSSVC